MHGVRHVAPGAANGRGHGPERVGTARRREADRPRDGPWRGRGIDHGIDVLTECDARDVEGTDRGRERTTAGERSVPHPAQDAAARVNSDQRIRSTEAWLRADDAREYELGLGSHRDLGAKCGANDEGREQDDWVMGHGRLHCERVQPGRPHVGPFVLAFPHRVDIERRALLSTAGASDDTKRRPFERAVPWRGQCRPVASPSLRSHRREGLSRTRPERQRRLHPGRDLVFRVDCADDPTHQPADTSQPDLRAAAPDRDPCGTAR